MKRNRKMEIVNLLGVFALLAMLSFAPDADAQHGGGMMMGPHGMGGQCQSMMPMMGDQEHCVKHPSSAALMKMLHKWGRLFFARQNELGLTEEQLDEMESILTSHVKSAIRKRADLKVLLIESQEILLKQDINLKAVEKKLKAMEALNTEMAMEGIQTLKKALAALTPEQQKQVRLLFKNTTFMRGNKIGMMPRGMMGPDMMEGMMGQGGMMGSGMMRGMMGQPGMMGEGGTDPGKVRKDSGHDHRAP
jgi:hypothetical protein